MKKWIVLVVVTCMAFALMACGAASESGKAKNEPSAPIEVNEADIAAGELEIVASDWKFDKEVYAIRAGEAVTLTLNNIEGVHTIEILDTDYRNIKAKDVTELKIDQPGTYTIICSLPCGTGHRNMKATLVVVEA